MIPLELLKELKQIFSEEFGVMLTDSQTKEIAVFLVTWFRASLPTMNK